MSFFSYAREPRIPKDIPYFDQLESMLRTGSELGEGYEFDQFHIDLIGMDVDRLRFCPSDVVMVELRQATNQPKGIDAVLPPESEATRPKPFSKDVIVDLIAMHPAITFGLQHKDLFRCSTGLSSWRVTPTSEVNFNMVDMHKQEHGDFTLETRLQQLELVLGSYPVAAVVPREFYYLDVKE